MTSAPKGAPGLDPLTSAAMAIAFVVALNKPFYPLYVWYLAGSGLMASLYSLMSFPLFVALPFLARRNPLAARVGLVVVGTVDTLVITRFMGEATGTWLFALPCLTLAAVTFHDDEKWISRGLIAAGFLAVVLMHGRYGAPVDTITPEDIETLFTLNVVGAASLAAFIGLRYPLRPRREPA